MKNKPCKHPKGDLDFDTLSQLSIKSSSNTLTLSSINKLIDEWKGSIFFCSQCGKKIREVEVKE